MPNRSSSLTKALGFPEFEVAHIEYPQVEYGSATVVAEWKLSRREDEHDEGRVIAIGRLVKDLDGDVDGVRLWLDVEVYDILQFFRFAIKSSLGSCSFMRQRARQFSIVAAYD